MSRIRPALIGFHAVMAVAFAVTAVDTFDWVTAGLNAVAALIHIAVVLLTAPDARGLL